MHTARTASIAALFLVSIGIGLVACGQVQSIPSSNEGEAQTLPEAVATILLPQPVPSIHAIPSPVATGQAIATEHAEARAKAPTIEAERAATATAIARPVLQKDYGSWSFIVFLRQETINYRPGWRLIANARYVITTEGLKTHARHNQELARRLADEYGSKQAEVFITFHTYVSPEQFNRWASDVGIRPRHTDLRVLYDRDPLFTPIPYKGRDVSPDYRAGDLLRVDSIPGDAEPLPRSRLDEALAAQGREYSALGYKLRELKGVYFTSAIVEARQLPRIAGDPSVFLADVTYPWIRHELRVAGVEDADEVRILTVDSSHAEIFRSIEDVGSQKSTP